MESHRNGASGSSPDFSRIQQGYNMQQPGPGPRGGPRPLSSDSSSTFGVRIQVQGIEGHPYVVLNNGDSRAALPSGGLESYSRNWDHQEESVNAHSQSDYTSMVNDRQSPLGSPYMERSPLGSPYMERSPLGSPYMERSPLGSPYMERSPLGSPYMERSPLGSPYMERSPLGSPYMERSLLGSPNMERSIPNHARGGSLTEVREGSQSQRMLASTVSMFDFQDSHLQQLQRTMPTSNIGLNFQRHPELLKPYNPDWNSLSPLSPRLSSSRRLSVPPTQTTSVPRPGHLTRGLESGAGAALTQGAGSRPGPARIPLPAEGIERAPTQTQGPGPAPVPAPAQTQGLGPVPAPAQTQGLGPVPAPAQTQGPGPAPVPAPAQTQGLGPVPAPAQTQGLGPVPAPAQTQGPGPAPVPAPTQTQGLGPVPAPTQTQGPGPVSAPGPHHHSFTTLLSPPSEVTDVPRRSPNAVDTEPISSIGSLINQFDSPQQMVRAGPRRGRIAPEDRRRSRSVDSRRQCHSYPLDPSSPASAVRGTRGETPGGVTSAPGSPKGRGANGHSTLMFNKLQWEKEGPSVVSPKAVKVRYRVEKTSLSRSRSLNHTEEESKRETQVTTPDLLKGQRGLQQLSTEPQRPNEDATKQILFTYLNDGTTDLSSTTQKKVNLVFDRINQLKWKTAENVEDEIRDSAAETKALQQEGAELEREVSKLKTQLEHKTKNGRALAEACERAQTDVKTVQQELDRRLEELSTLRDRLAGMEAELEVVIDELVKVKAERERGRTERKVLQQQLSDMHDELDQAKNTTQTESTEKQLLLKDLAQLRLDFQELIQVQEEQEEVLHWRERELTALKGALKEEVESHDKELGIMKEVYDKEVQKLQEEVEEVKESNTVLGQEKEKVEEERGEARGQVKEQIQEREELKGQVEELERKVDQLNLVIKESKTLQRQLVKCVEQLKREKQQVEGTLAEVKEKEEEISQANKDQLIKLENVQSELTQLNHHHREVKERLTEERRRTEELRRMKSDLEEERRLQNSIVEKLQREMSVKVEECEASTEQLQLQVDEVRKKSHTELTELQQQLQEKGLDLEKSQQNTRKLQEELLTLEQGLERSRREWEEDQQRGRQLERKVEDLEERNAHAQEDHTREVKLIEGQMSQLEQDLQDERSSTDLLMNRVDQGKQQMELIRGELLQERAVKQDLECDKITLERQNKDLKSRVSHLEGSQRSNQDVVVSRLEGRIQELEGRLEGEERDNINLQQANRKLERKVKEMMIQVDDEHISMQNQNDQLNQRLKTAKRQMDGAEEEIERLENSKRKLQRDLDEQIETNDQILSQLNALRSEMSTPAYSHEGHEVSTSSSSPRGTRGLDELFIPTRDTRSRRALHSHEGHEVSTSSSFPRGTRGHKELLPLVLILGDML
uniref:cingulin-like protein 1 isoform X2 n=1 Tax=Oncorhynchus gorbuscha TaxID=8017 RepID=UPI001EAE9D79|nr:cingulin-like protein 1 isoform X2 [Oncorhynchus gorbuscha]